LADDVGEGSFSNTLKATKRNFLKKGKEKSRKKNIPRPFHSKWLLNHVD
jgi:hypothetical protein